MVRPVRPGFGELSSLAILLGGRHIQQAKIFGNMLGNQRFNGAVGNLQAVIKQTVQQHAPPILLDALGVAACLEVDGHGVDAVHLLVG